MSLYRLINRRLPSLTTLTTFLRRTNHPHPHPHPQPPPHTRHFSFSSAEEAAAERRRRKRRLRIEPPLHALRQNPSSPRPPPDPNSKPIPDTTSSLTGPRLNLHNRVQSLIRAGDLDNASIVARQAVFSRTRPTVFTCNALIASMYRAKRFDHSVSLFHFFFNQSGIVPNIVSYNFLIAAHCECGNVDIAKEVYGKIIVDAPFSPSAVTFRHLTKGLVDAGRIGDAVDMLREMLNKGLGGDSLVYNNLIKGFLDLGEFDKANELFDELKERCLVYDGVVNATFMEWFFDKGRGKEAMESYRSLLDRKFRMIPATCNVLLEVLLRNGKKKEAWELFDTMLDNHTTPTFQAVNSETFNIMVNECFKEGKFDEAVSTFKKVGTKAGSRPFVMDVAGYTNMIVKFAEHGMISEAERFFNELQTKSLSQDVTAYRTLIDAYLKEKRIDDALGMFTKMADVNLQVIPLYANRWFTELIENNKAVECSPILTKMGDKEVKPDSSTYEIVIKGLVGVGAFDVVVDIVGQVMRYSVGVTPSVRELLLEAFEKEGRKEEMEKLLDERRQGYWQQSRPQLSGPPIPPGVGQAPRSAGPPGFRPSGTTYSGQRGPSGYPGPSGPTGYPPPSGSGGYPGPSGPGGFQAPTGQGVYQAPAGHGGYSASIGQGGYQAPSGQGGYPAPSGQGGYPASSGPAGYQAPSMQGGYSAPSGPTGYQSPAGQGGFSASSGPVGYQAQAGQREYQVPAGQGGYTDQWRPTGYPAPQGTSTQGPSGETWNAGGTNQLGHSQQAEPSTFRDRQSGNDGFQGPPGTSAYQGGQGMAEQRGLPGPAEQIGGYPGSGYRYTD